MGKRKTIKKFIDWCVSEGKTEWMGYYRAFDRVYEDYETFLAEEKNKSKSNE